MKTQFKSSIIVVVKTGTACVGFFVFVANVFDVFTARSETIAMSGKIIGDSYQQSHKCCTKHQNSVQSFNCVLSCIRNIFISIATCVIFHIQIKRIRTFLFSPSPKLVSVNAND